MTKICKTINFYETPIVVKFTETDDGELFIDYDTIQSVLDVLHAKVEDAWEAFEMLRTGNVFGELYKTAYNELFDHYRA